MQSRVLFASALTGLVVACGAGSSEDAASGTGELTTTCDAPRTLDAMFADKGSCVAVAADGGTWVPRALFASTSALDALACSFDWSSPTAPSTAAIATVKQHVTDAAGRGTINCTGGAPPVVVASVNVYPNHPMTPAHGCDVCIEDPTDDPILYVGDGEMYGLVPEGAELAHANVLRSDGVNLPLWVPTAPGPFRVKLPSLPSGTTWVEGPLKPTFD